MTTPNISLKYRKTLYDIFAHSRDLITFQTNCGGLRIIVGYDTDDYTTYEALNEVIKELENYYRCTK